MDLSWTNIVDTNALGNVYKLYLRGCTKIKDVSKFGNVHTLDLRYTKITDVSMLGTVHTLFLNGCKNITDIRKLGSVKILDITECSNIKKKFN